MTTVSRVAYYAGVIKDVKDLEIVEEEGNDLNPIDPTPE